MPSTVIAAFSYDHKKQILRITFLSGIVYDYKKVPHEVFEAMNASFSKGIYFNQNIKGVYAFEKVKG